MKHQSILKYARQLDLVIPLAKMN
ncbi:hypothetical protein F978_00195, partial [Acinetobacter baumannii NIPH 615]